MPLLRHHALRCYLQALSKHIDVHAAPPPAAAPAAAAFGSAPLASERGSAVVSDSVAEEQTAAEAVAEAPAAPLSAAQVAARNIAALASTRPAPPKRGGVKEAGETLAKRAELVTRRKEILLKAFEVQQDAECARLLREQVPSLCADGLLQAAFGAFRVAQEAHEHAKHEREVKVQQGLQRQQQATRPPACAS